MAGLWTGLDEHIKLVIQTAGVITAVTVIVVAMTKSYKNLKDGVSRISWLFSEQHDHKVIKESLDSIASQLTNNGGTSLKDAVDRIESKQDFMTAHMRTSLHANSKAIFETDREGGIIYVNKAYMRLTGFSGSEVNDMGWVNIIHHEDRSAVVRKWKNAVESRRDFDEYLRIEKPGGERFDAHAMAYVIRNHDGRMLGHIGELLTV
jgi:PAS domain S-box-containing protein